MYVGAGARLPPARGLALDPARWAWMPKVDGCYAEIELDGIGRITAVTSRAGAPIAAAAELLGLVAGAPDSRLVGEFEAHTEAGNRVAAARGWRALHLFDVLRYAGEDVAGASYSTRYGLLHRGQAMVELDGRGRDRAWRLDGGGAAHDRRGRYCPATPSDLRRLPVVPLARGRGAGEALWREHVELGGGEGLVAVDLTAPAGARSAKRKIKATETLDCRVIAADGRRLRCVYGGHAFTVGGRAPVGAIVEVRTDGWYESGVTPRFPRVVRTRTDLAA
jgi:hypothetical protein